MQSWKCRTFSYFITRWHNHIRKCRWVYLSSLFIYNLYYLLLPFPFIINEFFKKIKRNLHYIETWAQIKKIVTFSGISNRKSSFHFAVPLSKFSFFETKGLVLLVLALWGNSLWRSDVLLSITIRNAQKKSWPFPSSKIGRSCRKNGAWIF